MRFLRPTGPPPSLPRRGRPLSAAPGRRLCSPAQRARHGGTIRLMSASRAVQPAPQPAPAPAPTGRPGRAGRRYRVALGILLALAAVARGLILAEHWAANPFARYLRVDAQTYWDWAGRIAAGAWSDGQPFFSGPLYPYLVALVRAAGGGLLTLYVLQAGLDLLTAGLLAGLARRRFGDGVGLLSAAAYLLLMEPASASLRVLPSSLQLLLVALAWRLLAGGRGARLRRDVAAGVVLGLLALAWPPAIVYVPVAAAWRWWDGGGGRAGLARAAGVLAAGVLAIAPATVHNYWACGELIPVSAQAGVTFAHGNAPDARGIYTPIAGVSTHRERQNADTFRVYRVATGRAPTWNAVNGFFFDRGLAFWREQPGAAARLLARKAYWFLTGRHYDDISQPALETEAGFLRRLRLCPLPTAWLIPPALVAAAAWLRRPGTYLPELMLLVVPLLVVVAFFYTPRYRLPAVPVITVGAAWTLAQALRHRGRSGWTVAAAAAVGVAGLLGVLNRAVGFDGREAMRPLFEHSLGVARAEAGRYEEAVAHYRRALELAPGLAQSRLGLAEALQHLKRFEESLPHALAALEDDPESASAHNLVGCALGTQGRLELALAHFSRAVELEPEAISARGNLGKALAALGRTGEALEHARRLDEQAQARARAGRFGEAVRAARHAADLAAACGAAELAAEFAARAAAYESGRR